MQVVGLYFKCQAGSLFFKVTDRHNTINTQKALGRCDDKVLRAGRPQYFGQHTGFCLAYLLFRVVQNNELH